MALGEITRRRTAPPAEPSNVRTIKRGNLRRFTTGGRRNGKVPPKLINVNANMLVATATRESIPNWNIAGTVMIDVLPVITLTLLVAKKIAISASKRTPVTASILASGGRDESSERRMARTDSLRLAVLETPAPNAREPGSGK
jgi:hypothetical protein